MPKSFLERNGANPGERMLAFHDQTFSGNKHGLIGNSVGFWAGEMIRRPDNYRRTPIGGERLIVCYPPSQEPSSEVGDQISLNQIINGWSPVRSEILKVFLAPDYGSEARFLSAAYYASDLDTESFSLVTTTAEQRNAGNDYVQKRSVITRPHIPLEIRPATISNGVIDGVVGNHSIVGFHREVTRSHVENTFAVYPTRITFKELSQIMRATLAGDLSREDLSGGAGFIVFEETGRAGLDDDSVTRQIAALKKARFHIGLKSPRLPKLLSVNAT